MGSATMHEGDWRDDQKSSRTPEELSGENGEVLPSHFDTTSRSSERKGVGVSLTMKDGACPVSSSTVPHRFPSLARRFSLSLQPEVAHLLPDSLSCLWHPAPVAVVLPNHGCEEKQSAPSGQLSALGRLTGESALSGLSRDTGQLFPLSSVWLRAEH